MVRALRADARPRREHALGRFAERNGDDPLPLRQPLAGAQEERHAGPAPIVDRAFQRDEGLGIGLGVDAGLGAVAGVLPAHDMLRVDRQHAAKDLVLFLADGPRLQRRRRLHRHERENLEQVGDHHVAIRPGRLVEGGTHAEPERLRNVDLHMIDEVAVPDRLEQAVGEAECEDVLRRLLAQEVVDAEDLVLGKDLVQLGVQRDRAFQIGAERLFHDDAGALDEARLRQQAHGRQGGIGRHAEIVYAPALLAQFPLGLGHRRLERVSARADRHVVQRLGKGGPVRVLHLSRGELIERLARDLAEAIGVDLVERDADDPATGDEPGARQVEQAGQQLAPRQVAGGAHQDNNLRMLGTNPRRNLCHACPSPS